MKKRTTKKLTLNKETLAELKKVTGGAVRADQAVDSEGPDICYFSDCNPCETTVFATS